MNTWFADPDGDLGDGTYKIFWKTSDLRHPAKIFLMIDERWESINNGQFSVVMNGLNPYFPNVLDMLSWPGIYHNGASSLNFADGHSESHRWRDSRTLQQSGAIQSWTTTPSPNNPDVTWLQQHATHKK